jgi:hypothetical protein
VTAPATTIQIPIANDASIALHLPTITDAYMRSRLAASQSYTLLLIKRTPKFKRPEVDPIIWEHGRRNMALQQAGLMPIVCPARDQSDLAGICIFTVPRDRVAEIFTEDPGVKAGIFTFELHPVGGFPGSALPAESQVEARSQMPSTRGG